ncbi:unnamed protein product [Cylindrotheca closterium]|uniref:Uncharacterized protein n=1 Tax=Cylindrotheca closterium TaxID=2856 RepID=A0AAD2FXA6_9STRA|nr:unnamed protein product [Cylindrotheca closterium]
MLAKRITFLFTAIATFLLGFVLQPENLAFQATMAPAVVSLDHEDIPSSRSTVSLNLSFEIHPQAVDLYETVTAECQELYNVYGPIAIDLFNTASDEFARAYEIYQPIAWELLDQTVRPLAMDILDIVSTEFQQLFGTFTEEMSAPYSLFGYGRIEVTAVSYDASSTNQSSLSGAIHPAQAMMISTNVTSSVTNLTMLEGIIGQN